MNIGFIVIMLLIKELIISKFIRQIKTVQFHILLMLNNWIVFIRLNEY